MDYRISPTQRIENEVLPQEASTVTKIEDYKKKFKKLIRVKQQRKVWEKIEQDGEVARKWYKIDREVPVPGKEKKGTKEAQ